MSLPDKSPIRKMRFELMQPPGKGPWKDSARDWTSSRGCSAFAEATETKCRRGNLTDDARKNSGIMASYSNEGEYLWNFPLY